MTFNTTQEIIAHYQPLRRRGPAALYGDAAGRIAVYHTPTRHWHWFAWSNNRYEQTGSTQHLFYPGCCISRRS